MLSTFARQKALNEAMNNFLAEPWVKTLDRPTLYKFCYNYVIDQFALKGQKVVASDIDEIKRQIARVFDTHAL